MASEDSPFDSLVEAFREAKEHMVSTAKSVKADIVQPADPNATRLSRRERVIDYEEFMSNPARRESEFLRLKDRYKLPDDKPIPRRLVQYILDGQKDKSKAEGDSRWPYQ